MAGRGILRKNGWCKNALENRGGKSEAESKLSQSDSSNLTERRDVKKVHISPAYHESDEMIPKLFSKDEDEDRAGPCTSRVSLFSGAG